MKKDFTLLEVIIATVLILVLATFGVLTYQQVIDYARQKVCSVNLQALTAAAETYALEHDGFPSSLSQLSPDDVRRAYAEVLKKEGMGARLAFAILRLTTSPEAYAQFLTPDNLGRYGASAASFHCPADDDNQSYAINKKVAGLKLDQIPEDAVIIVESDVGPVIDNISQIAFRHRHMFINKASLYSVKNKKVLLKEEDDIDEIQDRLDWGKTIGSGNPNNETHDD